MEVRLKKFLYLLVEVKSEVKNNMPEKKPTILFTIEHKEREFIPKCFLAYELVKRGFRVYIGTFAMIDRVAKKIGPSIFFHKSTFVAKSAYYKSLGHKFVFMDEEGGITIPRSSTESFCQFRYKTVEKKKIDAVFLPGKNYEKYILPMENVKGVSFFTAGWPRVDLWREKYRNLYDSKVQEIKTKYGKYYLLITSFGMTDEKTYRLRMETSTTEFQKKHRTHKYKALLNYIKLIKDLSDLMQKDEKLIVRPHPSESIDDWNKLTKDFDNVLVVRDGDIAPWMLAADSIVQYGSTTATQAALNGITCIQYKIDKQDGITDTPSFELCRDANTPEEVYELLQEHKTKKDQGMIAKAKEFLKEEMAYDEDELAVTKIANALKQIAHEPVDPYAPKFYDRVRPYLQYAKNYVKLYYYKINKFVLIKKTMMDKIPGGIQKGEVKSIISLLSKKDDALVNINYNQVCKDLVLIERS